MSNMETEKVVPSHEIQGGLNDASLAELIQQAQESDVTDRQLPVMQAVKKYKKAVFWAMFLSTSLIMEGYDLVIVSTHANPLVRSRLTVGPDHLVLWPDAVQEPVRGSKPRHWRKGDHCSVAIWSVERSACRSARRVARQRVDTGSVRMSADDDGVHGMDGGHDIYSSVRAIAGYSGMG